MKWLDSLLHDSWKTKWDKLSNAYNASNFRVNLAKSEILQITGIADNLAPWLVLLGFGGIILGFLEIGVIIIGSYLILLIIGHILVKIGWQKQKSKIANYENPELMLILRNTEEILQSLKDQKKAEDDPSYG